MVDAWGGWNLFQGLLRTMKSIATKHGVSIPTVAVRYVLDQVSHSSLVLTSHEFGLLLTLKANLVLLFVLKI